MKTFSAKNETVQRDWYVVDAAGKTLGRLAAELAHRLRGKHKPVYTPHVDTGDYMVVVNADKIAVTGNKLQDKMYYRFTGYIGNLKSETLAQALERHPERVIEIAVKGMLPKNTLGRAMYRKLKDKMYYRFTGYIGNLKSESLGQALNAHPESVIETAVKGMLPKNPLGRAMYGKLKVYKGPNHPHIAQQPQALDI